jgi:hypothetical protein
MYSILPALMQSLPFNQTYQDQAFLGQSAPATPVAQLFIEQEEPAALEAEVSIDSSEPAAPVTKFYISLGC